MRNVILQIDVTMDGFAAGRSGETDWVTADPAMHQDALELLESADTILLGRVAYQLFSVYWPFADVSGATVESKIAAQINQADKVIFSRTLDSVTWGRWNNARLAKGDIAEEITRMKAQPGKNMLLYAGAEIVSNFIQSGLIDDYRLRVHPIALGSGKPLFAKREERLRLKLIQTKAYANGALLLNYRPIR